MRVIEWTNALTLGGTEKAACLWARLLRARGHQVRFIALEDGPRRRHLEAWGIPCTVPPPGNMFSPQELASLLDEADVIHAHAPGYPHLGDLLGQALRSTARRIPVVQTNIFGKLENPAEDAWTNFRLFISWTSGVQAARRAGRRLDQAFFQRQSVAVYPVEDPFTTHDPATLAHRAAALRDALGIRQDHVLYGRFSRPEPNKWTPLVLRAFLAAQQKNPRIRLLLREPPGAVADQLTSCGLAAWFDPTSSGSGAPICLLQATADPDELMISQMACDVVLHTSSIGESFGYGLAELMALGKPVITNSVPWHDQAQIELVRHGECGLLASTPSSMKAAILRLAQSSEWRLRCGALARKHVLQVADPEASADRLELAIRCALDNHDNPWAANDLEKARDTAEYLDQHQWGHDLSEKWWLRSRYAKVRLQRMIQKLLP